MIKAEILKIRTLSTGWVLAWVALGVTAIMQLVNVLAPTLVAALPTGDGGDVQEFSESVNSVAQLALPEYQRSMLDVLGNGPLWGTGFPGIGVMIALFLGVIVATSDFRFGGIITTALATPSRLRVVGAKAAAVAIVTALGAIAMALITGLALLAGTAVAQVPIQVQTGEVLSIWGRGTIVLIIYGLIGLAAGLLIRHQVAAVIAVFALVLVEPLISGIALLATGTTPIATAVLPLTLGPVASSGETPLTLELFTGSGALTPLAALIGLLVWGAVLLSIAARRLVQKDLV
ncbi:hypothetical protein [Glaciibacter superstes]|uniref:hypothetical protein n=1 Tax=Glaciibacter superstes TaxID=501023 RepID=UPI0003B39136|nr:hypothetical protein [Glaciibacter superstes]